jgi:hypothetical protein
MLASSQLTKEADSQGLLIHVRGIHAIRARRLQQLAQAALTLVREFELVVAQHAFTATRGSFGGQRRDVRDSVRTVR